jgi:hypothetical protein
VSRTFASIPVGVPICDLPFRRLLTNCYMRESYYDVVDVDSFGSESMHFPAAVDAVRFGGLLYLTSTDGFTSSGKRPERSLAAYGSYARATPWANEQAGLRGVTREVERVDRASRSRSSGVLLRTVSGRVGTMIVAGAGGPNGCVRGVG